MEYKVDFDVNEFKFWSGAKDTIADVERYDLMEELGNLIEETFADTMPTDTEINDYVWFERDEIYSRLGLNENGERETDKFPIGTKVVVIDSAGITDGTIATITGYNENMDTYPLEVEYTDENEMKEKAQEALQQIEDREYVTEFQKRGVKEVWKYGIAFCGKKIVVHRSS